MSSNSEEKKNTSTQSPKRYRWTEENLKRAIEDVKLRHMSIRQAGIKYGIPSRTLGRRLITGNYNKARASKQTFNFEDEMELAKNICGLQKAGYSFNKANILKMAYDVAKKKNPNIFVEEPAIASPFWLEGFLKKYPEIQLRDCNRPEINSYEAVNETPNPLNEMDNFDYELEFDKDISEDEKCFYLKVYPSISNVLNRKLHCTACNCHIGTAPSEEERIRMHPILKVTHCIKCHEFYNSGEFSKGDDGSELYCRWCGQGGEVYCCSKCPYVFCKNCIILNLSQECIIDIEQNENWNCFVCAPKIMWHLRAQHWALMNFINKQKKMILSKNLSDSEIEMLMNRDLSICCKKNNLIRKSRNSESLHEGDSASDLNCKKSLPKLIKLESFSSDEGQSLKKKPKLNDEVICTPDVMSMLQVDNSLKSDKKNIGENQTKSSEQITQLKVKKQCLPSTSLQQRTPILHSQLTVKDNSKQINNATNISLKPKPNLLKQNLTQNQNQSLPPLTVRNFSGKVGNIPSSIASSTVVSSTVPSNLISRRIINPGASTSSAGNAPYYHNIGKYRIDLNKVGQQTSFRLPNGKLIQVRKQSAIGETLNSPQSSTVGQVNIVRINPSLVRPQIIPQQQVSQTIATQILNQSLQQFAVRQPNSERVRPPAPNVSGNNALQQGDKHVMLRQNFPHTPIGQARLQLQNQIFSSMETFQYLMGKLFSLTNSNAYKSVKTFSDIKDLYIHLSYLFTYAIGRFKNIQDKCLEDMRKLGFSDDAACLQKGEVTNDKNTNKTDEDIEIIEPKPTCIDLDSDEEDEISKSLLRKSIAQINMNLPNLKMELSEDGTTKNMEDNQTLNSSKSNSPTKCLENNLDFNILTKSSEVDVHENKKSFSPNSDSNQEQKMPRKKITIHPNPHLIKQQRERIEEFIRNDIKLNSICSVVLERIEDIEDNKNILSGNTTKFINLETIKESIPKNISENKTNNEESLHAEQNKHLTENEQINKCTGINFKENDKVVAIVHEIDVEMEENIEEINKSDLSGEQSNEVNLNKIKDKENETNFDNDQTQMVKDLEMNINETTNENIVKNLLDESSSNEILKICENLENRNTMNEKAEEILNPTNKNIGKVNGNEYQENNKINKSKEIHEINFINEQTKIAETLEMNTNNEKEEMDNDFEKITDESNFNKDSENVHDENILGVEENLNEPRSNEAILKIFENFENTNMEENADKILNENVEEIFEKANDNEDQENNEINNSNGKFKENFSDEQAEIIEELEKNINNEKEETAKNFEKITDESNFSKENENTQHENIENIEEVLDEPTSNEEILKVCENLEEINAMNEDVGEMLSEPILNEEIVKICENLEEINTMNESIEEMLNEPLLNEEIGKIYENLEETIAMHK